MTTFYKSGGREITPNNLDDDLTKHLETDGWSTEKPAEVTEVPVFTEMTVEDAKEVTVEDEE